MQRCSSAMPELYIQNLNTEMPGHEEAAGTRERLRACFPAGASRRMTQLGMLVGSVLGPLNPSQEDTLIYASAFGESRSLEAYLDSFPTASPTLFQTSIHPSGAQQVLIGRQLSVRRFFPLSGRHQLVAQALVCASVAGEGRVLFCGGEERGSWLRECGVASDSSFAFATELTQARGGATLGRVRLERAATAGEALTLEAWCALLKERKAWAGSLGAGWRLSLEWF